MNFIVWLMAASVAVSQPATSSTQDSLKPPETPVEACDSRIVRQAREAIERLKAAAEVHGGAPGVKRARYEGTLRVEAHMMRPGMTSAMPVEIEVIDDPAAHGLLVRETTGQRKSTETTICLDGRVAYQADPSGAFKELTGDALGTTKAEAACWTPWSVVRAALSAGPTCRLGAREKWEGGESTPITFVDASHHACTVFTDDAHRVERVETLGADQRLGDVCNWVNFGEFEQRDGVWVPKKISRFMVRPAITLRYDLVLTEVKRGESAREVFELPAAHKGEIGTWGAAAPAAGVEFVSVSSGVWTADIAASDSRVLIVERAHDLVTVGAPDGDEVCGTLLAALKAKFPEKPIGIAAIGHHHPAPSGGLRAMAASGATIVLPRGLEGYARWMLGRSTALGAPAVEVKGQPRLQMFEGETTIDCGEEQLRLIDIGEKSAHAFHFVVSYLPKAGVLFEDDLGYFPASRAAKANPRLVGLVEAMSERHVTPTRLIQAWPVKDVLREVPWADVEAIVKDPK